MNDSCQVPNIPSLPPAPKRPRTLPYADEQLRITVMATLAEVAEDKKKRYAVVKDALVELITWAQNASDFVPGVLGRAPIENAVAVLKGMERGETTAESTKSSAAFDPQARYAEGLRIQELNEFDSRRVRPRLRNDHTIQFEPSVVGNWVDADYAKMLLRNVTELRAKVAALRAVIDTLAESNNAKMMVLNQRDGKVAEPAEKR